MWKDHSHVLRIEYCLTGNDNVDRLFFLSLSKPPLVLVMICTWIEDEVCHSF